MRHRRAQPCLSPGGQEPAKQSLREAAPGTPADKKQLCFKRKIKIISPHPPPPCPPEGLCSSLRGPHRLPADSRAGFLLGEGWEQTQPSLSWVCPMAGPSTGPVPTLYLPQVPKGKHDSLKPLGLRLSCSFPLGMQPSRPYLASRHSPGSRIIANVLWAFSILFQFTAYSSQQSRQGSPTISQMTEEERRHRGVKSWCWKAAEQGFKDKSSVFPPGWAQWLPLEHLMAIVASLCSPVSWRALRGQAWHRVRASHTVLV